MTNKDQYKLQEGLVNIYFLARRLEKGLDINKERIKHLYSEVDELQQLITEEVERGTDEE